jgi:hypothetical protein
MRDGIREVLKVAATLEQRADATTVIAANATPGFDRHGWSKVAQDYADMAGRLRGRDNVTAPLREGTGVLLFRSCDTRSSANRAVSFTPKTKLTVRAISNNATIAAVRAGGTARPVARAWRATWQTFRQVGHSRVSHCRAERGRARSPQFKGCPERVFELDGAFRQILEWTCFLELSWPAVGLFAEASLGRYAAASASNRGLPSMPPISGSTRSSGCGINPITRRFGERIPAMLRALPLRFASGVISPAGVA